MGFHVRSVVEVVSAKSQGPSYVFPAVLANFMGESGVNIFDTTLSIRHQEFTAVNSESMRSVGKAIERDQGISFPHHMIQVDLERMAGHG